MDRSITRRVYVCGPVSGVEGRNVVAFERARAALARAGYEVVIPHDVVPSTMDDATQRGEIMRRCLRAMLGCDAVATLPGWQASVGARQEVHVARLAGIPVRGVSADGVTTYVTWMSW